MSHARANDLRYKVPSAPPTASRIFAFIALLFILTGALAVRLVVIQVVDKNRYLAIDARKHPGPDPEPPLPGSIYARNLEPMAVSVPAASLCVNPQVIADSEEGVDAVARNIAERTGLDANEVRAKLRKGIKEGRTFIYVARLLDPEQVRPLKEQPIKGVWITPEYRRVYPGGSIACHVIGRCTPFHEPQEGIELRWAFLLAGVPGTRPKNMDTHGRSIPGVDSTSVLPPRPGRSMVLTIDWALQQVVEMALDDCMARNQPKSATCVVMDPDTGEILALASRPNFNPAHLEGGSPEEIIRRLKNLPVVRQYEPGSLFKVLLAAAVLESPDYTGQTYYCSGQTEIGGKPLRCWGRWAYNGGHGTCDLTRMLAQSCNITAARFALLVGKEYYRDFLASLGFGHKTGVEMPGEAAGLLRPADQMTERDLANLGFGQGVAVNDIQMVSAICAVVNGGHLMQPHVVKAIIDGETGQIMREIPPLEVRQVCSAETSAQVREMMAEVVEKGTGAAAAIEGLRVGGKTGTAQKWIAAEGGFVKGRNIVSFVMVAPLDKPRFVILVTADEPKIGEHGADVAAPVARTIALAALRQAGLLPERVEINEDIGL